MAQKKTSYLWLGALALSFTVAHAQSPQQIIQQVVNAEHQADLNDHSKWIYLEEIHKPKEHVLQWVANSPQGDAQRILEKDGQEFYPLQQRELIQQFMHDPHAQKKQVSETNHDNQQIDDLLQLLPNAFLWTVTGSNAATTTLHFEPDPNFHPPTREARVFSSMAGDLVADNQQHRVRSMRGHLMREVTFGGGILGRLKEGSAFSLKQEEVGPSLWQLTEFHVQLEGNALLFKNISLQQDDERSRFESEPSTVTLEKAADIVMNQPQAVQQQTASAAK
ncbi:hypothetical protein [Granulicella sp. S156]|jgi:hypothetical protein|uniref:hypothetical protein n=1 Tax=Granulicella sp. S156 TaxID=1747224 RepID=UPI0020B16A1C|nr:hypothetical protein [Granulicella sp. S156]